MRYYLVLNPSFPDTVALVEAPSTEKARTVFLDYLERMKGTPRELRGRLREVTTTKKISDPSQVDYNVDLSYGITEGAPVVLPPTEGPIEESAPFEGAPSGGLSEEPVSEGPRTVWDIPYMSGVG